MGLSEGVVRRLSSMRGEPDWVLDSRLRALHHLDRYPASGRVGDRFLPDLVRQAGDGFADPGAGTGHRAGTPARDEADAGLDDAGVEGERHGVVCCDLHTAIRDHPDLVQPHLGRVVPVDGNGVAALNTTVWSTGSFVHVPPGVEVDLPIEADNPTSVDRFERTLIVAGEGSRVHYIEGCSAPVYSPDPVHSAVVEIVVGPRARVTHTTIQNWSSNVTNLVTKGADVGTGGHLEWVDGDIGSRLTIRRPVVRLGGPGATARLLAVAYAGRGQQQITDARVVHTALETSSSIVSKAVSRHGGRVDHRSLVRVDDGARGCRSHTRRDALVLDDRSSAGAGRGGASRLPDEQLFYLMTRGLSEEQAVAMVVNGFIEPVTRALPIEYAVEWSRLIELQLEDSIG
jgi:Fe-S cluster assembly protein SufB